MRLRGVAAAEAVRDGKLREIRNETKNEEPSAPVERAHRLLLSAGAA
jgi:hypothetical protein